MKLSIHKDQRGLSQILLIALVVVVVGGVGAVGWKVSQKDKDTKASSTASVDSEKIEAACLEAYDDKDLCAFTGNYDLDKLSVKMTFTSTVTGDDAQNSKGTFELDGKGNSHSVFDTSSGQMETISLNKTSYLKDTTDGKWFKMPAGGNSTVDELNQNPTSDLKIETDFKDEKSKISYKKIGKEKCGKLTCFKYQIIDKESPNSTQFLWFDDEDYRMQRYSFKDDKGSTDMTISYQAVKISAPSPTKEYAAPSGAPTQAEIEALQQQAAQYSAE